MSDLAKRVLERLRGDASSAPPKTSNPPNPLESARLSFALNANLRSEPKGDFPPKKDVYPAGSIVVYRSPLFGDLLAQVIEYKGACVWIWHPIKKCECAIPRHWITELSENR